MPTTIGSAYVQILPSTEGIQGQLTDALKGACDGAGREGGAGFGGAFSSALGTAGKVALGSVAALGTAVAAAGGTMVAASGSVAQYGDNIDKMSQKMGLSAEKYQEWDAVMQHSGTSMEAMKASMKTLANAAETNSAAFGELGISQEQLASMSQEELFEATIAALQNVEDSTKRTYLAGKTLGRGATELGALLNTSAEDTQAMRDRVHELGGVMSDEAVKAAAAYQDSLQDMGTAFSGLSRNMISEFLPGITTAMNGLTEIFSGNGSGGITMISEGITQIVTQATEELPRFLELGGGIVAALLTAITANLPALADAGADVVLMLANGAIDNLPMLGEAALNILASLAGKLGDNLPELIPAGVEMILELADTLIQNSDKLVEGAGALMVGLAQGLVKALPILLAKAPELIYHLATALIGAVPQLFGVGVEMVSAVGSGFAQMVSSAWTWGSDLIQNFIDGILSKVGALWDNVKGIASGIKSYIGFSEPEQGPLSNFHTYAPDMMDLFAQGIREGEGPLRQQLRSSFDFSDVLSAPALQPAAAVSAPAQASEQRTTWLAAPINITLPVQLGGAEVGRTVFQLYNDEANRVGVRLVEGGRG